MSEFRENHPVKVALRGVGPRTDLRVRARYGHSCVRNAARHSRFSLRYGLLAGWLGVTAIGCQAPPAPSRPTEMVLRVPDRDAFLNNSMTLLRQYNLPPKRIDRQAGQIVTERTTSAQWFEFWRVDSPGAYQTLESSLQTIGRIVTVDLLPDRDSSDQPGPASDDVYRLRVEVEKYRYNAPQRQVTTASGALGIYSERMPTKEGLRGARSVDAQWVPLGRDGLLEAYLLTKLLDVSPGVEVVE